MSSNKELGSYGEQIALEYLKKKGFIFLAKNLKLFCGEIDLLMQDKNDLVLCEVKTKSSDVFGLASDMITLKKKKKLRQLAKALWQKFPKNTVRIDVVAIDNNSIDHIVSAVEDVT